MNKKRNAILGSFIADSSGLGAHWIYGNNEDVKKVLGNSPFFIKPDIKNYDEKKDYFAHNNKEVGDLSPSGEGAFILLKSLYENSGFIKEKYIKTFYDFFKAGGEFIGYIDHATKESLKNIESKKEITGANDFQSNGVHKICILAAYLNEDNIETYKEVLKTSQNNDIAIAYMYICFKLVILCINGLKFEEALNEILKEKKEINSFSKEVYIALEECLAYSKKENSSIKATIKYGQACGIKSVLLSSIHTILVNNSYKEAIRNAILAGGDNIARLGFIGAIKGAEKGLDTKDGIPLSWLLKVKKIQDINKFISN